MKLQSQVTLNDTEVKLAIATYIEANGIAGAVAQADSVILKRSAGTGFSAVLDVIKDTDPVELPPKVETEVSTEVSETTKVLQETLEEEEEQEELASTEEVSEEEATQALDAAQVTTSTSLFR